jgi:hypothetical protein
MIPRDFRAFLKNIQIIIYRDTKEEKLKEAIENYSVEEWLLVDEKIPSEFHKLENYKKAQEVINSPLTKALKESK